MLPEPPPKYVNLPASIVFDARIPDGPARTLAKIYGYHWKEKPRLTAGQWIELLGTSKSTFWGHLAHLRVSGWLPFSTAADGVIEFDFSAFLSENSDTPLLIKDSNSNDSDSELLKNKSQLINNMSKISDKPGRDPLLDDEAVKAYRRYTHLTANFVQRRDIVEHVKDTKKWEETIKHWLGHGWSPTNLTGMIDSYKSGGRAVCTLCNRKNGNGRPVVVDESWKETYSEG